MRFWLLKRKVCAAAVLGLGLILIPVLVFAARQGPVFQPVLKGGSVETGAILAGENDPPKDDAASQTAVETTFAGAEGAHADGYYVECRLERERSRGRQVELLRSIMNDPKAGAGARQDAQDRLLQISRELEREVSVENILRAKGLRDAAVFFQNEMVTVVVPPPATAEQVTTVVNLVARSTGAAPENIMVIARDS